MMRLSIFAYIFVDVRRKRREGRQNWKAQTEPSRRYNPIITPLVVRQSLVVIQELSFASPVPRLPSP
jgi:hypothetical protein